VEDALEFIKSNYFNKFFKPTPAILQAMHKVSAGPGAPGRSGIARNEASLRPGKFKVH